MNRMQKNSDRWGWAYLDMLLDRFQKLLESSVRARSYKGSIHGLKVPNYWYTSVHLQCAAVEYGAIQSYV